MEKMTQIQTILKDIGNHILDPETRTHPMLAYNFGILMGLLSQVTIIEDSTKPASND